MKALLMLTTLLRVGLHQHPARGRQHVLPHQDEQGFFKVSGTLNSCKAHGESMVCTEIDSR